jgi:hypothetical protein
VGSWVGHFDALRLFGPLRMAQRNRVNPTRRLDQASHPSAWDAWCSPKPANEVEFEAR